MDDSTEDVFRDTISEGSVRSKGNYMNLSRFTIYHSAQDLEEKMMDEDGAEMYNSARSLHSTLDRNRILQVRGSHFD